MFYTKEEIKKRYKFSYWFYW